MFEGSDKMYCWINTKACVNPAVQQVQRTAHLIFQHTSRSNLILIHHANVKFMQTVMAEDFVIHEVKL